MHVMEDSEVWRLNLKLRPPQPLTKIKSSHKIEETMSATLYLVKTTSSTQFHPKNGDLLVQTNGYNHTITAITRNRSKSHTNALVCLSKSNCLKKNDR